MPPKLVAPVTPPYPESEHEDARVLLRVTVSAEGRVTDVVVLEGREPFAGIADQAVRAAPFDPATRGTRRVSAVIRLEVLFHAPEVVPVEPDVVPEPPKVTPTKPAADTPEDVRVVGTKLLAPTAVSIGRAEVRELPGAFGDPFRAIDVLPGVTPIISGLPYYYVRGAPPGNVGFYLDGVRVPYLFHFGLGPSVVHPALVDKVDLHPGAYPASFGRFAGAIVSGDTIRARDVAHGEANLRLFDAGALVEVPFAGGRGAALAGGRYSYTAALLSLVSPDTTVSYQDYQARVSYDLTRKDTLSLFGFGAYDFAAQVEDGEKRTLFASEFHRADLRLDHRMDSGGMARLAVTFGLDRSRLEGARFASDLMLAARGSVDTPLSKRVRLRAGFDTTFDVVRADPSEKYSADDAQIAAELSVFSPRLDTFLGAWVDAVLRVTPRLEVTPGLRFDVFTSKDASAVAVDPRIAARLSVTDRFRLVHAFGLAHQTPAFIAPIPGFSIVGIPGGLQRSVQTSAGVETDLPWEVAGTMSVFHNAFYAMSDALGATRSANVDGFEDFLRRSRGDAFGVETSFRRKLTRRVGGLLTYTLSRSNRATNRRNGPSAFDRTHVLNAAVTFDIGKGFRAGSRFVLYTGIPVRQVAEGTTVVGLPERTPVFPRLDLRVEKRWTFQKERFISVVLEGQNVTLTKEILDYSCEDGVCKPNAFGPVSIGSLGVEGGF
ncbi:MAG: TonB-dependent receptor [Polyangiaceae bacterium]